MLWLLFACTEPEKEFDSDPPTRWKAVYGGRSVMCGIKLDGHVGCWGPQLDPDWFYFYSSSPYLQIPDVSYLQIALADGILNEVLTMYARHGCGITEEKTVVCWGEDTYGQTNPSISQALSVSVANDCSCGVTLEGTVECWGACRRGFPDAYQYTKVQLGYNQGCGLTNTSEILCNGYVWEGWDDIVDIAVDVEYILALRQNGNVVYSWDGDTPEEIVVPGFYKSATISQHGWDDFIICGIIADGSLSCFANDDPGGHEIENVPSGTFTSVAISDGVGCAVDSDSYMHCWGYDVDSWVTPY